MDFQFDFRRGSLKIEDFESNVDYTTVLSDFEGPLDLLLYLIDKNEIEIHDIFVSQVTEQFLDYMKGLPYLDVDKVSEYLNIAASIIKIKAQSLVPNLLEDEYVEEDIEEEKAQLIRALEEYKLIKEETAKLKELEKLGYFFKEPDKSVGETKIIYTDFNFDALIEAYSAFLMKHEREKEEEEEKVIPRDEYTVAQKITFILESLETEKQVHFEQLFGNHYTKAEIVTTFQAMLELLKHQFLRVVQTEMFGDIVISLNPDRKEEDTLGTIDEYN